ncbi:right-handed parallel beta-helix repeat-containing protein [Larkinella insperata]|uniref:Right-handed parallel beta-helix repeat-containing protein n=1 Tax=Larkinella insperata TaxID=332158 RepID=A0ABW3QHC8_9BACT|nr:right-handed parallel beta-helix repeat-containing protein [Larkinella insperata]
MVKFFEFLLFVLTILFDNYDEVKTFYVSTNGLDSNSGTKNSPFATIRRAQSAVKSLNGFHNVKVYLLEGHYFIDSTIVFRHDDGGKEGKIIEYIAFNGGKVVVSGGKLLPKIWNKPFPTSNLWKLDLSYMGQTTESIRQLFANNKRLKRAASKDLYTKGPLTKFTKRFSRFDFSSIDSMRRTDIEAFCGFAYKGSDLDSFYFDDDTEIIVYHSWECSWHKVLRLDNINKCIYFTSPSRYPVGFFSDNNRYRIENNSKVFDEPGEWYYNSKKKELWYLAHEGENPNEEDFYVPILNQIISIAGNSYSKKYVENLTFKGIEFKHSSYSLGINDLNEKVKYKLVKENPWLKFSDGYASAQTAPDCGQAISISYAENCKFEDCKFSNLGSYAVNIGKGSNDIILSKCVIQDVGGGGVLIGFNEKDPVMKNVPWSNSPYKNIIKNCKIYNGGKVHPSSVAIAIMQANSNLVTHNTIYNFPYSGISIGWTWTKSANFTKDNKVTYNQIYNVMEDLADGGGIYTLGKQPGCIIKGNHIHNIVRSESAIGALNCGIFFDQSSSMMTVDDNKIDLINGPKYRFNKTDSLKINWKAKE